MRKLITLFIITVSSLPMAAAANNCPDMPASIGTVSRDFKADISVSLGSFGKLRAGEVAIKAEAAAKNLFDKYPDINRRAVVEMMFSSYCSMVNSADIPDREKLDRLEAFSIRLQHLVDRVSDMTPSKSGQPGRAQESQSPRPKQESSKKAYNLSQDRRDEFLGLLKIKQGDPRDTLRIGCVPWSEAACLAAGKFLILFSEAGWRIDANQVHKVEPAIPVDGVSLTKRSDEVAELEMLPPHKGRWVRTSPSEVMINMTFTQMGVPVHSSRDPSLPSNMLGIYFGPEPPLISIHAAKRAVRKQIMAFLSNSAEVERTCSQDYDESCTSARHAWELEVSRYLMTKRFDSSVVQEWKSVKNTGDSLLEQVEKQKNWLSLMFYRLR